MFKKYEKTEAPPWQRKLVLFLASISAATLLLFVAWVIVLYIDRARVDECLDQDSSYEYDDDECPS